MPYRIDSGAPANLDSGYRWKSALCTATPGASRPVKMEVMCLEGGTGEPFMGLKPSKMSSSCRRKRGGGRIK